MKPTPAQARAIVLDTAYAVATARAGANPNALGFLRRVPGSDHYRPAPNGADDTPTERELATALATMNLAARVGRW